VTITNPTTASTYTSGVQPIGLAGTASDVLSGMSAVTWTSNRIGGGPFATGGTPTAWTIGSVSLFTGLNVITVTGVDQAGNSASAVLTVTYDTSPPTVTITSPSSNPTFLTGSATVTLSGTATDDFQIASATYT